MDIKKKMQKVLLSPMAELVKTQMVSEVFSLTVKFLLVNAAFSTSNSGTMEKPNPVGE